MLTTAVPTATLHADGKIQHLFELQKINQFNVARTTARERIAKLRKLEKALFDFRPEIHAALQADFRKPAAEVNLTEIFVVLHEIRHAIKNLRRWMAPKRVPTPLALLGSRSHIRYEPKGVVLILSPWNYPVNLTLGPLVTAIAAGNCVMLKPSELTPHTSAVLAKLIQSIFDEREVALVEGGVETAQALLELPFHHIFYTGSPAIGKVVMAAAAKNLSSVTLELGGKSPTIVDETAHLGTAARRIAWAKFTNTGQTCIAPDYVLVHERRQAEFLKLVEQYTQRFFGANTSESTDYARMVNARHFARVKNYLDDAIADGATIASGGQTNADQNFIAPTVLTNVDLDAKIMQEEIFGPVLPVLTFKNLNEALDLINAKERPLALYIYSRNQSNIDLILQQTRAGDVAINHSGLHFFNNDLPFGGVNNSGIGKAHGWFGFEAFSNAKGVFRQTLPSALELLFPPYNNFKQKMIDLILKWL
jgi:aldehyde dehydrogenase (NAD+)